MIIFIAGIHGSGKSYLSNLTSQQLGIRHASASQLIKEERGKSSWGQDKQASQINENQIALISAVSRIKNSGESLLLDGHFVLRDTNKAHTKLPVTVFRDLNLDKILLIETNPQIILDRLAARGDHSWSLHEIIDFGRSEAMQAEKISNELGLPMKVLNTPSQMDFQLEVKITCK